MSRKKLPPDWGIDALAAEAKKRGIDYGQLVAQTTLYERDQIREEYRRHHGEKKQEHHLQEKDPKHLDLIRQVRKFEEKMDE